MKQVLEIREDTHYFDVVVAGGGPAGFSAAIAAARNGIRVLLVESGGCLGGTSTLAGLPLLLQSGTHVLFYSTVFDVRMEQNKLCGVYVLNKGGIEYIACGALIDCTGDADLVFRAGYETYKGDRQTGEMTHMSLITHLENIDSRKIEQYLLQGGDPWFYEACRRAQVAHPDISLPDFLIIFPMMQKGVFMINGGTSFSEIDGFPLDGTNPMDLTKITLRGRQRANELCEYIFKEQIAGAEHCRIRMTAAYPGVRETRRIVGEYILSEQDMVAGKRFADTIALAGRHFDLARRQKSKVIDGESLQEFAADNHLGGSVACIPYRSLIPKGSRNILAAGRCISADGQALGPARIMSTCMAVGQAAGTAAYLSIKEKKDFIDVNVVELQTILRLNNAIIDA